MPDGSQSHLEYLAGLHKRQHPDFFFEGFCAVVCLFIVVGFCFV